MNLPVLNNVETKAGGTRRTPSQNTDAVRLEEALRDVLAGEVRFDIASKAMYSTDASNYRQIPVGVVLPRDGEDVVAALKVCREHGVPIVARGGGTSLAGQCCNAAVVIDCSKYMNRILEIDPERRVARVQPGVVLDELRERAEREYGLTYGPDPATHDHCTFGGMIGNNSCGIHSVHTGRTADNVLALEVVTYDGERLTLRDTSEAEVAAMIAGGGREGQVYRDLRKLRETYRGAIERRYPKVPRRVSGYNLHELIRDGGFNLARALVGSEGTCVFLLEATVRLVSAPKARTLVVLGYPDVYSAGDHVPTILEHQPIGLEGIDEKLVDFMKTKDLHPEDLNLLPEGRGWLLTEFGADTREEAEEKAKRLKAAMEQEEGGPSVKVYDDPAEEGRVWEIRESGLGATAFVPAEPDAWPGWEDAAVHPENVGAYLRDFRDLLKEFGYNAALYGHFGDGCIHCRITFDLVTKAGIEHYKDFLDRASDLVLKYDGSFSGEHGDGQARGQLLEKMFGPELVQAFREFKTIWDPEGMMNPGKVIDAYPPDSNLRLGLDYEPKRLETYYQFPADEGDFGRAALRCVGVGKCRRTQDAFMCPSYLATHDERDSTRGRARALFEMTRNDFITDGWRSDAVHETLDLCIGCKGCKRDCPVDVDMATYKAEFLAHYYAGRVRPRHHYAMGLIGVWGKLASIAPGVANFFGQTRPFAGAAKWLGGIAPERRLPKFARKTFRKRNVGRAATNGVEGQEVVLLPDAFNDHFFPETLEAAERVLTKLGYGVIVPKDALPAIRPLIHYGMLRATQRKMRKAIEALAPFARAGKPIIVLEPSTASVYREEVFNMFPQDPDGERIGHVVRLLSEFLIEEDAALPHVGGRAVLHGHCHQKSVLNAEAARVILRRMEVEFEEPESGCCGMAGSFGYERGEHYDVSTRIGEMNLLPAVRSAGADTWLIADGFSCREQIEHGAGRRPLHLAEFLDRVLSGESEPASG